MKIVIGLIKFLLLIVFIIIGLSISFLLILSPNIVTNTYPELNNIWWFVFAQKTAIGITAILLAWNLFMKSDKII